MMDGKFGNRHRIVQLRRSAANGQERSSDEDWREFQLEIADSILQYQCLELRIRLLYREKKHEEQMIWTGENDTQHLRKRLRSVFGGQSEDCKFVESCLTERNRIVHGYAIDWAESEDAPFKPVLVEMNAARSIYENREEEAHPVMTADTTRAGDVLYDVEAMREARLRAVQATEFVVARIRELREAT